VWTYYQDILDIADVPAVLRGMDSLPDQRRFGSTFVPSPISVTQFCKSTDGSLIISMS